jgi:hypothetical protein
VKEDIVSDASPKEGDVADKITSSDSTVGETVNGGVLKDDVSNEQSKVDNTVSTNENDVDKSAAVATGTANELEDNESAEESEKEKTGDQGSIKVEYSSGDVVTPEGGNVNNEVVDGIPLDADNQKFDDAYNTKLSVIATNGYTYCGAYDLESLNNERKYRKPKAFVIHGGMERRYVHVDAIDAVLLKGNYFNI